MSAMLLIVVLLFGVSWAQYQSMYKQYKALYDKEAEALIRRKKDSKEVMDELLVDYKLDSKMSIIRELWLPKLIFALPSLLRSTASVATSAPSVSSTPSRSILTRQDPGSAASWALLHQVNKFVGFCKIILFAQLISSPGSTSVDVGVVVLGAVEHSDRIVRLEISSACGSGRYGRL
jgi:hypothetical protein